MKITLFVLISLFFLKAYAGQDWKNYPYHENGSKIFFPKDEGRHTMFPNLEWWYSVIHAQGEITGERYSILVTHFNNRFRFFTVTNLDRKSHISGTTMGKLIAKKGYLDLKHKTKYGTDIFRSVKSSKGELIPFEYEIKTHHDQMELDIILKAQKKPLMVAGDGYTSVGSSGKSWYYSLTRLEAIGKLTVNGFTENIKGLAWMDHQWGPFMVSPVQIGKTFETYEWFCIQLDDGSDLMISNIYNRKYQIPMTEAYGGVEYIDKNGKSKRITKRNFKRTNYWQDPVSGHFMSMGWNLSIPEWGLELEMTPDFKGQMVRFPFKGDFWEGSIRVSGSLNGKLVKGKAFGELIHRFQKPKIKLEKSLLDHDKKELNLSWKVKNPDEGNPLLFDVSIISKSDISASFKKLSAFELKIPFSSLRLKSGELFRVKIEAYSVDGIIRGEDISVQENFKLKI